MGRANKIFTFLIFIVFICTSVNASATVKFWIGANGGSFNDDINWSTSSSGPNDTTAPGSADIATFDSGTHNCLVDANMNVAGLDIQSGFGGIIKHTSGHSATIGTSNLSIAGGTYDAGDSTVDVAGNLTISGGTLDSTSGELQITGDWTHTAGGTFNHSDGTVVFDTTVNKDIDVATSETFYDLKTNNMSSNTLEIASGDSLIVTNTLTLNSGAFNTGTLEAQGNVSVETNYAGGTSPLKFSGSNDQNFTLTSAAGNFNATVTIDKPGGIVSILTELDMNAPYQDLIIENGAFDLNGQTLSVDGTDAAIVIKSGGDFQFEGDETLNLIFVNFDLQPGSTFTLNGTSGPYNIPTLGYQNLVINGSGAQFQFQTGAISVASDFTIQDGTVDTQGNDFTVTGTFSNNGVLKLQGDETTLSLTMDTDSGTIEYTGPGAYTGLTAGNTYYDISFTGSGTWDATSNLVVNNAFDNQNGTIRMGSFDLNVAGNWSNTGTFTPGTGTVIFDGGSQFLSGTNTFYNFTKNVTAAATLTFTASSTTTITNALTLTGASGNPLNLVSNSLGTAFNLDPQGARNLANLTIQDSNNIASLQADCFSGCTNTSGNTNWGFTAPELNFVTTNILANEAVGTITITAKLSSAISSNVSVPFSFSGTATQGISDDYTITTSPVTISAGSTTQNIVVTINNDSIAENNETIIVTLGTPTVATLASSDTVYTTTLTDNDTAGFTLTQTSSSTVVSEDGLTDSFTLVLDSEPTSTVTFNVGTDSNTSVDNSTLTFTSTNWNAAQTVIVSAIDDSAVEGLHSSSITLTSSSSDIFYATLSSSLAVSVADNDIAEIAEESGDDETPEIDDDSPISFDDENFEILTPDSVSLRSNRIDDIIRGQSSSGETIIQTETEIIGRGPTATLGLPNGIIFYGLSDAKLTLLIDGPYIYIADSSANSNTGIVWRVDTDAAPPTIRSWEGEITGVTSLEGSTANHFFGQNMKLCIEEDTTKIAIHSPGFGEITVHSADLSTDLFQILADDSEFTNEIYLVFKDLNDDGDCDVLAGARETDQSTELLGLLGNNLSEFLSTSVSISESQKAFIVQGSDYIRGSLFLSRSDMNLTTTGNFYTSAAGDFNGDGINDIVIFSLDFPSGRVVFGKRKNLNGTKTRVDADITIHAEDRLNAFSYSVVMGDVSGDGYEDIIIGTLNGSDNDEGTIYVVIGDKVLNSNIYLQKEIKISGTLASGFLGRELSLADMNDDGILDIIASEGTGDDTSYVVFTMDTSINGRAENLSNCSLNKNPHLKKAPSYWVVLTMLNMLFIFLFLTRLSKSRQHDS